MGQYLMGLDNGGTNTKAVLFDLEGNAVASASRRTEMLSLGSGRTERDMEKLWDVNCEVIKEAIDKAGIDPGSILGLSFSGHGKGLYLWGRNGKPAYNGIISTDTRAYMYPEKWEKDGTAARVFEKTCQRILPMQPVALLNWLKDNEPEVLDATAWIFGVKDYIRYRLTGAAAAEMTDISGSNLVNIREGRYDKELLAEFGLEDIYGKLPPLKQSTEIAGHVTEESAARTGLAPGTPVAAGMFDIDASAIAMKITDESHLCVIAGTWSINEYISKEPVLDGTVMMNSLYCVPGYYLVEECSPTSAANNEWFIERFMGGEAAAAREKGLSVYDWMNGMVEEVAADETSIVFLPFIFGSNYNPRAKASLVGMDSSHTKAQIARAIYEGIVFCHKVHIEKLIASNPGFKAVRLAGGAANSDVWVQIFADVLDMPVEIIDTRELGALGAAMAAGVAAGVYTDLADAAERIVKIRKRVEPIEKNRAIYQRKYELYKQTEAALEGMWEQF